MTKISAIGQFAGRERGGEDVHAGRTFAHGGRQRCGQPELDHLVCGDWAGDSDLVVVRDHEGVERHSPGAECRRLDDDRFAGIIVGVFGGQF